MTDLMTYHLPDHSGWILTEQGRSARYLADDGLWSAYSGGAPVGQNDLAVNARDDLQERKGDWPKGNIRSQGDRDVAGRTGYVIEAHGPRQYMYVWGTVVGHEWTYLEFDVPKKSPKSTAWIESILASVHWKK